MFQRTSQSDNLPFTIGVPAVRAKNIGLKTFSWSWTYLAWSKSLVENVHCKQLNPIPKHIASRYICPSYGSLVFLTSSRSVFSSISNGTLISTVFPLLSLIFLVSVGNLGCGAMWSSEMYWLWVIVLTNDVYRLGFRTPMKGMHGMVSAIRFLDCSTAYLYLIWRMISSKLYLVL